MKKNSFSKGEPAINEHRYHMTKNNTTKKHITHTIYIKLKHVILNIIDVQMIIITKSTKRK